MVNYVRGARRTSDELHVGTTRLHPSFCSKRHAHSLTEQRQGPFQASKHLATATSAVEPRAFVRPHHSALHSGALYDQARDVCMLQWLQISAILEYATYSNTEQPAGRQARHGEKTA